jgi:hypothetical protein
MSHLRNTLAAFALAVIPVTESNALSFPPGTDMNSPEVKEVIEHWYKSIEQDRANSTIKVEPPTINTSDELPPLPEIITAPTPVIISDPVCFTNSSCVAVVNEDGSITYSNPVVTPSVTFNSGSAASNNNGSVQPKGTICGANPTVPVCELLIR